MPRFNLVRATAPALLAAAVVAALARHRTDGRDSRSDRPVAAGPARRAQTDGSSLNGHIQQTDTQER
jgi:hypothetical protein